MGEDLKTFGDKMKAMKDEMQKTAQAQGKRVIKDALKAILDSFPEVSKLAWSQYTPYFNDGDACTFGVNSIEAFFRKPDDVTERDGDDDDEEGLDHYGLQYATEKVGKTQLHPDMKSMYTRLSKVLKDFDTTAQNMEEAFLFAFGDHVKVTVTRSGGVIIDEYQHD